MHKVKCVFGMFTLTSNKYRYVDKLIVKGKCTISSNKIAWVVNIFLSANMSQCNALGYGLSS